jgi:V/A-type H+-transporting ATPase subunit D
VAHRMKTPPGRAGRIWLRRRRQSVERGREQLERKLQILTPERHRLQLHVARLRSEWDDACRDALTWQLRLVLLGGEDAQPAAAERGDAVVTIDWVTSMGLSYPTGAHVDTPPRGSGAVLPAGANAAAGPAREAFVHATAVGAELAAAERALGLLESETAVTRRRLRALTTRVLPEIHEALHDVDLALEQAEQEEHVRLRRAIDGGGVS